MNKGKLIENNNFIDLPLEGSAYRWFRYSDIPSKFSSLGLTEIWFQKGWEDHYLDATHRSLPHVVSDHCPLFVEVGGTSRGKFSFKF